MGVVVEKSRSIHSGETHQTDWFMVWRAIAIREVNVSADTFCNCFDNGGYSADLLVATARVIKYE